MQRKKIEITVNQLIRYHDSDHQEEWDLKVKANFLELTSYSKVSYEDQDGALIEVKWYPDRLKQYQIVEIKQEKYNLVFNPETITRTHYATPQGIWELKVKTEEISLSQGTESLDLKVSYQITLNEESLADYEFRLQYQA